MICGAYWRVGGRADLIRPPQGLTYVAHGARLTAVTNDGHAHPCTLVVRGNMTVLCWDDQALVDTITVSDILGWFPS
jgi:hypothetical protein